MKRLVELLILAVISFLLVPNTSLAEKHQASPAAHGQGAERMR